MSGRRKSHRGGDPDKEQQRLNAFVKGMHQKEQPADVFIKLCFVYKDMMQPSDEVLRLMADPLQTIGRLTVVQLKQAVKEAEEQLDYEKSKLIDPLIIRLERERVEEEDPGTDDREQLEGLAKLRREKGYVLFWESVCGLLSLKLESKVIREQRTRLRGDHAKQLYGILQMRSYEQLCQLEKECQLQVGRARGDQLYWDYVLGRVRKWKHVVVLAYLREEHERAKEGQALLLKMQQEQQRRQQQDSTLEFDCPSPEPVDTNQVIERLWLTEEQFQTILADQRNEVLKGELRKYSLVIDQFFGTPAQGMRTEVRESERQDTDSYNFISQQILEYERSRPLGPNEEWFKDEVEVVTEAPWMSSYQSKKPFFVAKVRMGFDWTVYNRKHYDFDSEPPRVIQGYKFTLFYPDLVDRTKSPEYQLQPTETIEFAVLRFKAGPPYLDVAFKIVNKEWEFSEKSGYEGFFFRGILTFHFNFKKPKYKI